jgi:hypothetical protein
MPSARSALLPRRLATRIFAPARNGSTTADAAARTSPNVDDWGPECCARERIDRTET